MTTDGDRSAATAADLLQQADAAAREAAAAPEDPEGLTPDAMRTMLHDLRVHQIELEIQAEELQRTQWELEASRERYFDLYDRAPVGYCAIDGEGLVREANLTLAALLGVARGAIVGKPFSRFILREDRDTFGLLRNQVLATPAAAVANDPSTCELRLVQGDGSPLWVGLVVSSAPVEDGEASLRVVVTDIAARRQAEALLQVENEKFEATFEAVPFALLVLDATTAIVGVNAATVKLAGGTDADVLQRRPGDILSCVHSLEDPRGCGYSAACPMCPIRNAMEGLIESGGSLHGAEVELELIRNGAPEKVWMNVNADPIQLGGARHLLVAMDDITERRATKEALRLSEERHRSLFESASDPVFVVAMDTAQILDANSMASEVYGYDHDELLTMSSLDVSAEPEESDRRRRDAQTRPDEVLNVPRRLHRKKDGTVFPVEITARNAAWSDQRVLLVACRDVTERMQVEEALHRSTEDLVEAQRIAHVGNWYLDVASGQLTWSHELYRMYGLDPALPPPPYTESQELFTPESWARLSGAIQQTQDTGMPYELTLEMVRKDGSHGWMWARGEAVSDASGAVVGLHGVAQDVTDDTLAEMALRTASAHLQATLDAIPDLLFEVDLDGLILDYRAARAGLLAAPPEAFLGRSLTEVLPPAAAAVCGDALREASELGFSAGGTYSLPLPQGETWFELSVAAMTASGDLDRHFILLARDITERKRAEDDLRAAEVKYRALFETADDAILLFTEGSWVDCNQGALRVFGCTREQLIGAHPSRFSPPLQPDGRPSEEEAVRNITLAYTVGPQSFEWEHCRADATPFAAEVSLNRLDLEGKPYIQAIVRDVTERKRAEIELRQRYDDLARFSKVTVGREVRMIELKEEVNALLKAAGSEERYRIVAEGS